jgi:amino acid adenylation domain-containing protein
MQNLTSHGFRLSPQQRQIWIAQQAFTGQPFRAVGAFAVAGNLDSNRLYESLEIIVERHEILRTAFARPAGIKIPFQIVSENTSFFSQRVDLTNLAEREQRERIAALFRAECKQPLTLDDGPVLRCQIAELSGDRAVLLLSLPAICADSPTLVNLVSEIFHAYEYHQEPADVVQYADFAEWQNQLLEATDERAVAARAYWNDAAAGPAPVLPLEKRSVEGRASEVPVECGEELFKQLETVASESNAALSGLLFVSWQALVSRLSGGREFTIYNRCRGRKLEDFQAALGPYDRYLPIRCDLANGVLARPLALVTDQLRQAEETQEYAEAGDAGLLAGNAVAFEFEERAKCITETLSVSPGDLFVFSNPFKLKLCCVLSGKQLSLQLQYDPTTLDRETCERFAGYLRRVIQAVATTNLANLTVESIDLLSDDEKQGLLVELNDTSSEYSHDKCAHELFEAQVAKTPTAVAVVCSDQQLTYEQLNGRANQLAHLLREYGVGPSSCVGMCLTRSVEAIIGLLGILKAGAAYVPLDPEHPVARLTAQLEKARAMVCLTNLARLTASLDPYTTVIDFSRDADPLRNKAEDNLPVVVSSEALAYVIYTSGSTGTPKGVVVRHRNLVNYAEYMLKRLRVQQPLQFAVASTISADLGNTCIFPSLFSGGCLHILKQDVALEPRLFSDYLSRHAIDVLKIAPSHLQAILSDSERKEMLPSKYLILGGEAFSRQLLDSILAIPRSCKIINHYGPTETTVGSLTFDASEQELPDLVRTVPIGRPIANTRVYILDKHMRTVPGGVVGELYIGGAGVAVGYLNDPDLTAARFVPDPFSNAPGDRLYGTGDLVRILPGGNVEFLGRSDLQVKVRGYRIEPGEIEAVLSRHSLVSQAVVILRRDEGHERFVAYVMSSKLRPANADEIRQYLKERLPDYMVPAAIVILRSFPTTLNGKVDRTALPAPDDVNAQDRVIVAPQTTVERELAKIWSGLLNAGEISVHDDFFDLGGHSLLATQVISRIQKVFNKNIPLRTIFDSPTIAKLAGAIEAATYRDTTDLRTELAALESLSDEEAERLLQETEESNRS